MGKDRQETSFVWQGPNGSLQICYLSKDQMWQAIGISPIFSHLLKRYGKYQRLSYKRTAV